MEQWPYDVDAEGLLRAVSHSPMGPSAATLPMEEWIRRWDWPRKWLLFGCACVRQGLHRLPDPCCRQVLELAERYAEGESVEAQLAAIEEQVRKVVSAAQQAALDSRWGAGSAALALCRIRRGPPDRYFTQHISGTTAVAIADDGNISREVLADLCLLLQDIFGVAAWSGSVDPRWLIWNKGAVVRIARGIYEEQAFERMPILADALEEAGCVERDILGHCRQFQEHVRGCWVVDALLNRN